MADIDLYHNVDQIQSLAPAARTATADGASADLQGYGAALVLIEAGAWTDGTHTFQVEESDDDSTFTAVADADLQGSEPTIDAGGDGDQVYELGYLGSARYIRVVTSSVTGTTTGAIYGATIVRGAPSEAPVS